MAENVKQVDTNIFDSRVTIKGDKAKKLRELLEKKMKKENRSTYNNAIGDILLQHFGL